MDNRLGPRQSRDSLGRKYPNETLLKLNMDAVSTVLEEVALCGLEGSCMLFIVAIPPLQLYCSCRMHYRRTMESS